MVFEYDITEFQKIIIISYANHPILVVGGARNVVNTLLKLFINMISR